MKHFPVHALTGHSLLACLLALLCTACITPKKQTIFELLKPCTSEEGPSDGYCGSLEVAENPAEPEGRRIALKTIVLPAFSADAQPEPVFFLAGGPGQGSAELAVRISALFRDIRRQRDVVFVDQRGTGKSNKLECKDEEEEEDLVEPPPMTPELVEKCLQQLDGDPRFYTTNIAMDDLDLVREWLGYEQITPMGVSYGTRAALVYLKRHPEHVRSVILDAVAPPDMTLPLYFPRDAQRALDQLTSDCLNSATCNERFPALDEKLNEFLADLERNPRTVTLQHPRTGKELKATITHRITALTLTSALYSPLISSLVPLAIDRAAANDFGPLGALMFSNDGLQEEIANGMFLAVTCSEDYPRLTEDLIEAESAGTFAGRDIYSARWEACKYWPRGEVEGSFYEPVESDVPVLILSGEVDPVTPPSWGEHVAQHLPNSRHIIAPGTGHGVMGVGCGIRLIGQFLNEGSAAELDSSCLDVQRRPDFFVNYAGPYPEQDRSAQE